MKSFLTKISIFFAVMALVAVAGWYGRKAYKRVTERRIISQAEEYLEKKDFRNAGLCLQRAMQINPTSVSATRLMADVLETLGAPAALSARIRVVQLQPDAMTNRLLWAQTALKMQDLRSANDALAGLDEKTKTTAAYHKLAGALAWNTGRADEAESHYLKALSLEPVNLANTLNLATIHLTSTNAAIARDARLSLEQITTNSAFRNNALHVLLADAIAAKAMTNALVYSREILNDPAAATGDKINHLELLRQTASPDYPVWQASLKAEAGRSPEHAFALGRWLVAVEGPTNALKWLQTLPPAVQTNQPVPLVITDCQIALKDWKGILSFVDKQDWGEAEFYRHSLKSLAERSQGQKVAADGSWRKAARLAAHRLDKLSRLAQVAGIWGWGSERTEVLSKIVDEFPNETWAVDQLAGQFYAQGKTRELEELFARLYSTSPSNPRIKNNLASLFMLRKTDLDKAFRMARETYETSTNDPFFASTYAYSLFLQNKKEEAVKVLGELKPEHLQIPQIAAYYGIIQAQSGHVEAAREPLKRAQAASLLPEEKEIVRVALARK